MRDKRKPGVPYILEAFNLLHSSEEESSDDENQIDNGPSEELFHTEDEHSLNNPETQDTDSENDDSENHSEDFIDNSEKNTDTEDFFSDNCEESNTEESNTGNPLITLESDSSHASTHFEYDQQCDSDSSDNCLRPVKRRKY